MIAILQGRVASRGNDYLVLMAGGVGYKVYVPVSALARIPAGEEEIRVYTHLHVREDAMVLFGFPEEEELRLFEQLINVNGVGPKVALSILAAGPASAVKQAIRGENLAFLTNIPGIGKKTAQRIIIELKDKLVKESPEPGTTVLPARGAHGPSLEGQEAIEALQALGYSQGEALRAVRAVLSRGDASFKPEEIIRLALKELARF